MKGPSSDISSRPVVSWSRLDFAPAELLRQQGQHARMVARLARAFEVGRLVQRNIDVFANHPLFVEHGQYEAIGFDQGLVTALHFAGDGDVAVFDQGTAVLARAKALRLQHAVKG
jgi:hypothetical protein